LARSPPPPPICNNPPSSSTIILQLRYTVTDFCHSGGCGASRRYTQVRRQTGAVGGGGCLTRRADRGQKDCSCSPTYPTPRPPPRSPVFTTLFLPNLFLLCPSPLFPFFFPSNPSPVFFSYPFFFPVFFLFFVLLHFFFTVTSSPLVLHPLVSHTPFFSPCSQFSFFLSRPFLRPGDFLSLPSRPSRVGMRGFCVGGSVTVTRNVC